VVDAGPPPGCDNAPVEGAGIRERARGYLRLLIRVVGPPSESNELPWKFDTALGLGLAVFALGSVLTARSGSNVVQVVPGNWIMVPQSSPHLARSAFFAMFASLPLVGRRHHPLIVLWIVVLGTLALKGNASVAELVTCVIAGYSAAAYSSRQAWAFISLVLAAAALTKQFHQVIPTIPKPAVAFVLIVPIAAAGNTIRTWKIRVEEGQERMRVMEREQEETTRRAVELERARIARELHDVVTHNVSVMVVQAGAARKVLGSAPDQATEALLAVEASGRAAMAELRQVMGLLNSTAPDEAELAPQPGVDQLDTLVGRVRDAGLPVTLAVTGTPRPLPHGVGLAAYRVVQEALTNTFKHAVGASAHVTVTHGPETLRLEITDTGGTPGKSADTGNGRGLLGLRERLAVYGGSLEAGRRLTGGFRVLAVIPLAGIGNDLFGERV
jgi:signal transduction histidine kinase